MHLVATYIMTGQQKKIHNIKARLSPREKTSGVATKIYLRKTLEKPKGGLRILKRRVQELFTHREGISTPCTHHKEQQSLIEYAKRDFKIMHFPFFDFYYYFLGSTRVLRLVPRILVCDEEFIPT